MASIKGPKSALTDFIEEHGIIIDKKISNTQTKESNPMQKKSIRSKRIKKAKFSKPTEIINIKESFLKDKLIEKIIKNFEKYNLTDSHFKMISSHISKNRIYNTELIKYMMRHTRKELVLYDCSMIRDEEYAVRNDLEILELHSCGQLTNERINSILMNMNNLKVLRLTGGYLLTRLNLPLSLDILDLSHCSRIDNSIIHEINKKYKCLSELRLSYCYKLKDMKITTKIERLHLNETNFFIDSLSFLEDVKELSLSRCPNINELNVSFLSLEYLDIEGITTISEIKAGNKLKYFNCKQCFSLTTKVNNRSKESFEHLISKQRELEYLNLSYLNLDINLLKNIETNKKLKILDISWCRNVNDELINYLIENFNLKKLYVFGCFDLSEEIAKKAWSHKNYVKIIGNPAETKYLLNNM